MDATVLSMLMSDKRDCQTQTARVVELGSHGPGKLPEKRQSPKVVRGGCKRSFGPRQQKSPKSLFGDRRGTTKKPCDKDFAECSGELSGAICPKTLILLGNDR